MSHPTREKLKNTPFSKTTDYRDAVNELDLEIWRDLQRAKILNEKLKLEENQFFLEPFRNPWRCRLSEKDSALVSVKLSEDNAPEISLDSRAIEDKTDGQMVEGIIRAILGEFTREYLSTVRIKTKPGSKPPSEPKRK